MLATPLPVLSKVVGKDRCVVRVNTNNLTWIKVARV